MHTRGEEGFRSAIYLYESLVDPVTGPSLDPEKSAFTLHYQQPLWSFWSDNPINAARFNFGLSGFSTIENKFSAALGYPWDKVPPGTLVCDLGGGLGDMSMHIAKMNPNISVVVQDTEDTVNQAIGYWNGHAPELVEAKRVDFLPLDFLKDTPVKGCDYYYVRHQTNSAFSERLTKP